MLASPPTNHVEFTYFEGATREPWEEGTDVIESNTDPGDLVVVQPEYVGDFFPYYYSGSAAVIRGGQDGRLPEGAFSDGSDNQPVAIDTNVCVFQYGEPFPTHPSVFKSDRSHTTATFDEGVIRIRCYRPTT